MSLNLGKLPKRALYKISNYVGSNSYCTELKANGNTQHVHQGKMYRQPYNGRMVIPKSAIAEVSRGTRKCVQNRSKPSIKHAWVLQKRLGENVCKLINHHASKPSTPYLPVGNYYYGILQSNSGIFFYKPSNGLCSGRSNKNTLKELPKKNYVPVRFNTKSGLYHKVLPGMIYKTPGVVFVTKATLNRLPTAFKP